MSARLSISILLLASQAFAGSYIQNISGPATSAQEGSPIRGTVIFLDGDNVQYATCRDKSTFCTPQSPDLEIRRSISFDRYQKLLAELFNIPEKYLIADDQIEKNFQNTSGLLKKIIEDPSVSEDEKQKARGKFLTLTEKGGTIYRFSRARAIKRALLDDEGEPEDNPTRFEKSQSEFKDSNYPFNFVADLNPRDKLVIFEPSSELTWALVTRSLNRKAAAEACAQRGMRIPTVAEFSASQSWLKFSAIWDEIQSRGNGKFWLWDYSIHHRQERVGKVSNSGNPYTVIENYQDPTFEYVEVSNQSGERKAVGVSGPTSMRTDIDLVDAFGANTQAMDVVCVTNEILE